ncbi:MAG: hypothetical protein E4H40_06045 [Candidatus Brocadiia bacterium]|nr:MAG: hypothetical protein E4H40_06045 [Candidatus Brocadiia bacterium]
MLVPAGVGMDIIICPRDVNLRGGQPVCCTVFKDIMLEPGDVRDLGMVKFDETMPIYVKVIDGLGQPIHGINVENQFNDAGSKRYGWAATDEKGLARFRIPAACTGEFRVRQTFKVEIDGETRRKTITDSTKYNTAGPEDANSVFQLVLTDEMIRKLFE